MPDHKEVAVYAWIGEDEFGSGVIGLKQALTKVGMIPLAAVEEGKMSQEYLKTALQVQANTYKKTIRLCKFVFSEEIITLNPEDESFYSVDNLKKV